ncbi:MAG: 3-deoxy-D-manno-octulosonic acid transferase [Ottowia sp.]|nr:3-deoxy-D-manno-octulosonic acid transferase [Ottowia sp.]
MFFSRTSLALYRLAAWLAQPLLRDKLVRRARSEPGYAVAVPERFGTYATPDAPLPAENTPPRVWLHAVSLGEMRAAAVLLPELRTQLPGMSLTLTTGTATGREAGAEILREGDELIWQPWDTTAAVRRFFEHAKPDIGLLMETEIWPNLLHEAKERGVPVALVNARLSERSLRKARAGGWLMRPAYASLTAAWAQTEADAARLLRAGAPQPAVLGNVKFDARPEADLLEQGRQWRATCAKPVVMFASSREGEEEMLLDAIAKLGAETRNVQWLIVPRHPQRFDEVARLVRERGLQLSRRSEWGGGAPRGADVWLGDTMGEMAAYYALSDVALLGGSFAPLGGQNLIEATACGCPVFMGAHTFNFERAAELALASGAAARVNDMYAACASVLELIGNTTALAAMRAAAQRFSNAHRGAARRTAGAARRLLRQSERFASQFQSTYSSSVLL